MGVQKWSENTILATLAAEPQLGEELEAALAMAEVGAYDVVVDFSDTDIITSSSIAKLVSLQKKLDSKDRKLVLCGMNNRTKGVLEVCGLQDMFEFADEQFIALAGLQMSR